MLNTSSVTMKTISYVKIHDNEAPTHRSSNSKFLDSTSKDIIERCFGACEVSS